MAASSYIAETYNKTLNTNQVLLTHGWKTLCVGVGEVYKDKCMCTAVCN